MNRKLNNPGTTASCAQYFNEDIKLLWLEEGGTTSLELLTVSPSSIHVEHYIPSALSPFHIRSYILSHHPQHQNTAAEVRRATSDLPMPESARRFMGGYHFVTTLDFLQHNPIGGSPLFLFAGSTPDQILAHKDALAIQGHRLWQQVDSAIILDQQHRFGTSTPGGKALWDLVQLMWSTDPRWTTDTAWAHATATAMVDLIQSRVVKPNEMAAFMARSPKAIVLRNELKPDLNLHLAMNHAQQTGQRLVIWRCRDTEAKTHRQLSEEVLKKLDQSPPDKTADMPTYMAFFPGINYVFVNNMFPDQCWVNNLCCTGRKLLLDPKEPDDDLSRPYRTLQHHPIAVCVQPEGTNLGKLFDDPAIPEHCLPVWRQTKTFKVPQLIYL